MSTAATIDARLAELGLTLPQAAAPAANYVPYVQSGNLVFVSGQITLKDGALQYVGRVGEDFTTEEAYEAAKLCVGVNTLPLGVAVEIEGVFEIA